MRIKDEVGLRGAKGTSSSSAVVIILLRYGNRIIKGCGPSGGRKEKGAAALKTDRIRNLTHKHAHDNNNDDDIYSTVYIYTYVVCIYNIRRGETLNVVIAYI